MGHPVARAGAEALPLCGTVRGLRAGGGTSTVVLGLLGGGTAEVAVEAVPDRARARLALAAVDRPAWVRVDLDGRQARCRLHGTRHRRPGTWVVPLDVALALAAGGIPTVVSRRPGEG
ncbi:MAG: hypothetical protein ACRDZ9_00465 [Acidimicrobiales bacterium]